MTGEVFTPRRGDVIADRYRLDRLLGEGGIGEVYAATDTRLRRDVAVKLLRPHLSRRGDSRARFEREARVASQLRHPNAVQVFDFGEDRGALFLVMERLVGTTTWHELHQPPVAMAIPRAVHIAYCVADVLAAAHDIQLVHRDLKPDNIFVERSGETERIVVVDFGMAFIAAAAQDAGVGRLTEEGLAGGTPEYMSPEQAADVEVGPAADIYAFGCVLFELLTGLPPFQGNIPRLLSAHLYSRAPRVCSLRADTPAVLDELIADMMRKRPDERPTARAVRRRLAVLGEDALTTSQRRRDLGHGSDRAARMIASADTRPSLDGRETVDDAATLGAAGPTVDDAQPVLPVAIALPGGAARALETGADPGADDALSELSLALTANGIYPLRADTPQDIPGEAVAILALGAAVRDLEPLVATGLPVVADAAAEDFRRVKGLLRAGVAEVVVRPVRIEDVVRKLHRAVRKHRI